jgi:hypothetical protein
MRRYRLNATTFRDGFTMLSTNLCQRLEGVEFDFDIDRGKQYREFQYV